MTAIQNISSVSFDTLNYCEEHWMTALQNISSVSFDTLNYCEEHWMTAIQGSVPLDMYNTH
jgi:hypothetical protein